MTRFGKSAFALICCAALAPAAAQAARHGPDITLDQLQAVQNVSLRFEEHAPFTMRAEAPGQFKLSGLPTVLPTFKNDRATPQQTICASIRDRKDTGDAELSEVLSLALEFDYCADTQG